MTNPPDAPPPSDVAADGPPPAAAGPAGPAGATGPGSPTPDGAQPIATTPFQRAPRLPSLRAGAALAAGMLAIGVAVGAAIGPAPSASFAGSPIPMLAPSIAALAAAGSGAHTSTTPAEPPPVTPQATPPANTGASTSAATQAPESKTPSSASVSPTSSQNTPKAPTTGGGAKQTTPLPPVTSVWLITLAGGTFAQALAQPAAAPYIDSQLTKAGTLLNGWSALAGSAFASEAGLLAGTPPQNLDAIVQPPCPEGAAGVPCKPETAGALTAADEFLKATIPTIMSNPAYGAHGLIVITFATVGNATASSLPAGSSTATLGSEPPAGVLLISPFVRAGARPSTAYDPTSPKQSLSALLH